MLIHVHCVGWNYPMYHGVHPVNAWLDFPVMEKPLKRLFEFNLINTGFKPGVNEITKLCNRFNGLARCADGNMWKPGNGNRKD